MEDWTAATDEPKKFSIERVGDCDICVLLVARKRGFIPAGGKLSITQLEYQCARDHELKILPFLLDDDALWHRKFDELDSDPELIIWRKRICDSHGVGFFNHEPKSIDVTPAVARLISTAPARVVCTPFRVRWHLFAPCVLRNVHTHAPSVEGVSITQSNDRCLDYSCDELGAELTVYSYGGAVWRTQTTDEYTSLGSLALARKKGYAGLLEETHQLHDLSRRLSAAANTGKSATLLPNSPFPYVLSLIVLEKPGWSSSIVENALKLLCCPNLVFSYDEDSVITTDEDSTVAPSPEELSLLEGGIDHHEFASFCLPGTILGFASWAGVSAHPVSEAGRKLLGEFVHYEKQIQALWGFLHYSIEEDVELSKEELARIRKVANSLLAVEPNEPTPSRLFREAVISTSRIRDLWQSFNNLTK